MTTDDQTQPIKLSQLNPPKTAGSLPSARTFESCFVKPMAAENIEEVKGALTHIWLHYQALELAVSDRQMHEQVFENVEAAVQAGTHEKDITDQQMAVAYISGGLIDGAYDIAHAAGSFMGMFGMDPMTALKAAAFGHLDFSDPEREVTDAELEALLDSAKPTTDETTDETPKDEK